MSKSDPSGDLRKLQNNTKKKTYHVVKKPQVQSDSFHQLLLSDWVKTWEHRGRTSPETLWGAWRDFSAYPHNSDFTGQGLHTSLVKTSYARQEPNRWINYFQKRSGHNNATGWDDFRSFRKIYLVSEFTQSSLVQTGALHLGELILKACELGTDQFHSLLNWFKN